MCKSMKSLHEMFLINYYIAHALTLQLYVGLHRPYLHKKRHKVHKVVLRFLEHWFLQCHIKSPLKVMNFVHPSARLEDDNQVAVVALGINGPVSVSFIRLIRALS
jgi:hypothetical protein